jgi:SAM-dependent methyltransferase
MKLLVAIALFVAPALAQQPTAPAASAAAPAAEPTVVEQIGAEAAALGPLQHPFAQRFLDATAKLPAIAPRHLFSDKDHTHWYTAAQADALGAEARAALTARDFNDAFYWSTRYGTPVAYARPLDLSAGRAEFEAQQKRGEVLSIVDFGCGGLGASRLLASCGCRVVGIDVDPLLPALYSETGDTGVIPSAFPGEPGGTLQLVTGQWPADAATVKAVKTALPDGLDLFLSKNTLKRGYIHPERETDPKRLVHLGVDDATFVAAVAQALKPGGLFVIYNLCPAPAPADKPYIPWADGRCPFERSVLEAAGLEVLDFDVVDDDAIRAQAHALGWDQGEGAMDLHNDLFAWFTIARRPLPTGQHK